MDHDGRLEEIRQRLLNLGDELEDIGLDVLRQAVDNGETKRPPIEKTIATARRAVDKAARALEAG